MCSPGSTAPLVYSWLSWMPQPCLSICLGTVDPTLLEPFKLAVRGSIGAQNQPGDDIEILVETAMS